jgi:hypothetical protein
MVSQDAFCNMQPYKVILIAFTRCVTIAAEQQILVYILNSNINFNGL